MRYHSNTFSLQKAVHSLPGKQNPEKGQSNQQTGETTEKIPCTVNKKQINKLKNARRDKKLHPAVKLS